MLIGIRVDSSLKMGTGHTYRMLTLAHKLKEQGHDIFFISRLLQGNLIALIKKSFVVLELAYPDTTIINNAHCSHANWLEVSYDDEITQSQEAIKQYTKSLARNNIDWLIIDHYAIEKRYHENLRSYALHILQVDDLADRPHDTDLLLDQNYYQLAQTRYKPFISDRTISLLGPQYALLRDEFRDVQSKLIDYQLRIKQKRVVIFFGGIDSTNETSKALKGLLQINSDDLFDVIIGINNPHKEHIINLCAQYSNKILLHIQVDNITQIFANAYLYVGAIGATTWERCSMALPAIVCSVADNQVQLAQDLHHTNAHYYLGQYDHVTAQDYADAYCNFLHNASLLQKQSSICYNLVDVDGVYKVINTMEQIYVGSI